jgi:hypothetical protein
LHPSTQIKSGYDIISFKRFQKQMNALPGLQPEGQTTATSFPVHGIIVRASQNHLESFGVPGGAWPNGRCERETEHDIQRTNSPGITQQVGINKGKISSLHSQIVSEITNNTKCRTKWKYSGSCI